MSQKISAGAAHVRVEGRMDTSVINAYSLQDGNNSRRGNNCVGLILSDPDRRRAQSLDGQLIEVRGSVMGTGDLNTALPNGYGEINGRAWSGSVCDGQSVVYVRNIRVLLPQN